jgi:hypothetical protein
MKRIISLVVLISSIVFSQNNQTKSIAELKQLSTISFQQSAGTEQIPTFNVKPFTSNIEPIELSNKKKSAPLAILYSLLLPGMGELYAERFDSGKYFTIADGVLWGVFAGFEIYGNWQEKNYKSFAETIGGVNLDGKDSDYFANIGNYQSIDEYNAEMDLNEYYSKVYNTSTHYWKWANTDQRREYRNMWSKSENAYNNVRFVVGALILNRVVSVINAVRLVAAYNKNLQKEVSWNIYFGIDNKPTMPSSYTLNFVSAF